jgi:formylglycine-generating enzyme required for sulfatase activity
MLKKFCSLNLIFSLLLGCLPLMAQNTRQLDREKSIKTDTENRTALIIGNADYVNARKLVNSANDATDMANTLRDLGFDVISGVNLSLKQMEGKVREFGDKLKANGGVGLFYYAGHGIQVNNRNYLIPVEADIPREDEVDFKALNLDLVLRKMATANNGLNIVILDACRNNPFARSWSRGEDEGGLAQVTAPTGTFIAYATSPDKTASDGTGRNGLYTSELLKYIRQPNLKIEDAFKQVTIAVDRNSGGKQVPWTSSSLRGEFYFKSQKTNAVVTNPTTKNETEPNIVAKTTAQQEQEAWNLVKNSSDAEDFRFFLKEFPSGVNAAQAKIRLEELAWQTVKTSSDKSKVQAYLNEFPAGANAAAARIKLRQLESAANINTTNTNLNTTTTATKTAGTISKTTLAGGVQMSFAYIPAGEFQMGSNESDDEKPVHAVKISQGFQMQTIEVTQAQWKAIMGALPSKCDYGSLSGNFLGDNKPIICVSWEDTQEFVRQLNLKNDGYKYHLPTEAEWEYSARAGTTGNYAGYLDSMAWYDSNSGGSIHDVGTKQANGWGLYDMHGNVWEWVQDWYDSGYYAKSPTTDPVGPSSGSYRVSRGGGWSATTVFLRSADRYGNSLSDRFNFLGFRVVRVAL